MNQRGVSRQGRASGGRPTRSRTPLLALQRRGPRVRQAPRLPPCVVETCRHGCKDPVRDHRLQLPGESGLDIGQICRWSSCPWRKAVRRSPRTRRFGNGLRHARRIERPVPVPRVLKEIYRSRFGPYSASTRRSSSAKIAPRHQGRFRRGGGPEERRCDDDDGAADVKQGANHFARGSGRAARLTRVRQWR